MAYEDGYLEGLSEKGKRQARHALRFLGNFGNAADTYSTNAMYIAAILYGIEQEELECSTNNTENS